MLVSSSLGCTTANSTAISAPGRAAPAPAELRYPSLPRSAQALASLLTQLETQLRAGDSPELARWAHQQQVLYRQLGRDPGLAAQVRTLLQPRWQQVFDHHIGARRALQAMNPRGIKPSTLPPWRIVAPAPAKALLGFYRKAQAATGIPWQVLAAVNLVETGLGRLDGVSVAGATGPMQFLPSTWAERGIGQGNIRDPHDAIQAAARYLVRRGGRQNIRRGLWGYNNSDHYGRAVLHYAALLRDDPRAFNGLYHWQIHLLTTAGDLWLPVGTNNSRRVPVQEHLRRFPQSAPAAGPSRGDQE